MTPPNPLTSRLTNEVLERIETQAFRQLHADIAPPREPKYWDAWRDGIVAAMGPLVEPPQWQDISTAPKNRLVLVANIESEVIHRVSDAKFNGLGWYSRNGEACHWRTHWAPMPSWWPNGVPVEAAAPLVSPPGEPEETLQCLTCQRRTTLTEAVTRKFKHHRCAHCEESEGRSGCLLLVKPVYGLTPDYVPREAPGERTPPTPRCVCHSGSVCGPACAEGQHHDGCAKAETPRETFIEEGWALRRKNGNGFWDMNQDRTTYLYPTKEAAEAETRSTKYEAVYLTRTVTVQVHEPAPEVERIRT